MTDASVFTRAARASDIAPGGFGHVVVAGHDLLICNVAGSFQAIENRCSHLGMPLDRGRLARGVIFCPFHGASFDVRTGASIGFPKCRSIRLFETRVTGDDVEVALP
ncbi:Rieske 2Fe-2S domain-containing protein [Sphingomonas sp. YL-JM2C]